MTVRPQMSQTLFDAERRRAVLVSATANYNATVASYRQMTLTAFQEVKTTLPHCAFAKRRRNNNAGHRICDVRRRERQGDRPPLFTLKL
jgi:outer membrane protein TolC